MSKIQKIWMGMFISLVLLVPIFLYIQGDDVYIKNQNLVFAGFTMEIIGLFGLLNNNIKFNTKKYKNIITAILLLLIIITSFILYFLFSLRHGIGF
jgi:hypothetical protein